MELAILKRGMFASNTYILWQDGEGAVIDAGNPAKDILNVLKGNNINLKYIILTHGHIDHILSVDEIKNEAGGKVVIHKDDAIGLVNPDYNGSKTFFGESIAFNPADVMVNDGDILYLGGNQLNIIHTPGHSPGGICIKAGDWVFTGDTLFFRSIGRTDIGGDYDELIKSAREKLFTLDDSLIVYPGHGRSSTIGYEKQHNPYFRNV